MAAKAIFIEFPKKHHKWKKLGYVLVQDENAELSLNEFDKRYTGPKSKYGQFIRDLKSKGVDISQLTEKAIDFKPDDLTIVIAKRLYSALSNKYIMAANKAGYVLSHRTIKPTETFDWKNPGVKRTRYYKMAERLLKDHDSETVLQIVNKIAGYA